MTVRFIISGSSYVFKLRTSPDVTNAKDHEAVPRSERLSLGTGTLVACEAQGIFDARYPDTTGTPRDNEVSEEAVIRKLRGTCDPYAPQVLSRGP